MNRTSDFARKNRLSRLDAQNCPHTVFLISCGHQIVVRMDCGFRGDDGDGNRRVVESNAARVLLRAPCVCLYRTHARNRELRQR
jgi:hypothetical protein